MNVYYEDGVTYSFDEKIAEARGYTNFAFMCTHIPTGKRFDRSVYCKDIGSLINLITTWNSKSADWYYEY